MVKMEKTGIVSIAIVGAESTGKTELCRTLAAHYNTVWVPEYAREYFNNSDIYNYTLSDLEIIAQRQIELEMAAAVKANGIMFCDTALITLKIWAELEFNTTPGYIQEQLIRSAHSFYLVTNNDVPWESDPQRLNKHSRNLIFEMNLEEIKKQKQNYTIVSGLGQQRTDTAIKAITKWLL